jgi:hypothetical protein
VAAVVGVMLVKVVAEVVEEELCLILLSSSNFVTLKPPVLL